MDSPSTFITRNFLLENDYSSQLYHEYAAPMPIIDYHNHLSPKDIATDRQFRNLTELWLEGDHYKWRAMRSNGINEKFCTGNAPPLDKFIKWAETVPQTVRNPLYHWTHLELKRYFNLDVILSGSNARDVYHHCSNLLGQKDFSVRSLLEKMNVEVVCTTDDPTDTLQFHKDFALTQNNLKMYPTFRPDKAYALNDKTYLAYIEKLESASGIKVRSYEDLLTALDNRMEWFQSLGCKAADHGLEYLPFDREALTSGKTIFRKALTGAEITQEEVDKFKCCILTDLSKIYHSRGWVQQFHLGAMRNNNSRMMATLGADAGFDSIGDYPQAAGMSGFMDNLDKENKLARTIIYNLNPADNAVFASMLGNFNDGTVAGKMQYGSGWWFLDQKDGMTNQINTLSNMGLLSRFIGMVTDSRSFLSFPRHEYFRRILCNIFGNDIKSGELPPDIQGIGEIVRDISYRNAKNWFGGASA